MFLERSMELDAIAGAVGDAAAGTGRVLAIEGLAGAGKSSLLGHARDAAGAAGMTALVARGGELESDFGFGCVRQLFDGVVRDAPDRDELFAGDARFAASLLGLGGDGIDVDVSFSALHGLYWFAVNLAERRPLALLVDDCHWADFASLRFLAYLAPRVEGLPVLLVVTGRPPGPEEDARHALARAPGVRALPVRPLSAAGTATLIESISPGAGEETHRACHAATGGNPFFVHEVAKALRDGELDGKAPAVLQDWSPGNVTRAVGARLAMLSPDARRLAHAAAIFGRRSEPRHAATLADLDEAAAAASSDELRRAGLLAPERPLEFLHPILRTAVYGDMPSGARATSHRRAARLLAAEGAGAEPVAAHLLHAEPAGDPWACEQLAAAGRESLGRGAPEAAARYLRRALDEPGPADSHFELLLGLGAAEAAALRVDDGAEHVLEAYEAAPQREAKLTAATLYAIARGLGTQQDGLGPLHRLREESDDDAFSRLLDARLLLFARYQPSAAGIRSDIAARVRSAVEAGREADAYALTGLASELAMTQGPAHEVVELAHAALDGLSDTGDLLRAVALSEVLRCLIIADSFEAVMPVLDRELENARRRGAATEWAVWAAWRSFTAYRQGAVFDAEADARTAYLLAAEQGAEYGVAACVAYVVDALVEQGRLEEAVELIAEAGLDRPAGSLPEMYTATILLWSRGRLRVELGELDPGVDDLIECGRRQVELGELNPATVPWRSTLAVAFRRRGELDPALRLAREELDLARAFGAPRATGMALRSAGVVEGGAEGLELMRDAVSVLEESPARLEHARALADLGEMERRTGCAGARTALTEALELAHVCGAAALEKRVLASLHAAGARPRRALLSGPDALTPREWRVAEIAAGGMPNREIAGALFVTVRTVEYHLQSAYRKLGIHSRTELAGALRENSIESSTGPRFSSRTSRK